MGALQTLAQQLTHGVYVIAVDDGVRSRAFTAAWVMQVSFEPLLLAFSINPLHTSYAILKASGKCTVNVLGEQHQALAEHFGRAGIVDKMHGYRWLETTGGGAPALAESLAYLECRMRNLVVAGDHALVVCEVLGGAALNRGIPMLYCNTGNMDGMGVLK